LLSYYCTQKTHFAVVGGSVSPADLERLDECTTEMLPWKALTAHCQADTMEQQKTAYCVRYYK